MRLFTLTISNKAYKSVVTHVNGAEELWKVFET